MDRRPFLMSLIGSVAGSALATQVEAEPLPEAQQVQQHADFNVMTREIEDHVRRTGHAIFSADSAKSLQIGFACECERIAWQISFVKVKESQLSETVRKYLATQSGRVLLANALSAVGRSGPAYR